MEKIKYSFTSWFAAGLLTLAFIACSSEDNAGKDNSKKVEPAPLAMGKPLRGFIDSAAYRKATTPFAPTRMTGIYGNISTGGTGIKFFFDKQEDYVDGTGNSYYAYLRVNMGTDAAPRWVQFGNSSTYTENGVTQPYTQSIETDADGNVLSALFHSTSSSDHLTKDSYKVRYGSYSASYYSNDANNYITIARDQYQSSPGKAMHLAQYGDYATATAEDNGLYYDFVLKHHNAFITFMPYAGAGASHDALAQCKLWRVRISSDQMMSNTNFYVDDNGLKTDTWPTSGTKYIDLYCGDGSSLSASSTLNYNIAASQAAAKTNGAIMVLAPGTYTNVKIEYYVYDNVVQNLAVFTKEIPSLTLTPGKNRPIYSEIKCRTENSTTYHEWGAMGPYWNAVNPEPTNWGPNGVSGTGYPQAGSLGYRSDVNAWDGGKDDAPTGSIDASSSPTANMMHWYIMHGDARYDNSPFIYRNHLFLGRIWFLKAAAMTATYGKSVADMSAQALLSNGSYVDLSTNRRTDSYSMNPWSAVAPAARSNYFYILPLGCYYNGTLYYMSSTSSGGWQYHSYWTRTAYPANSTISGWDNKAYAYQLRISYYVNSYINITNGSVSLEYQSPVGSYYRDAGYPTWPGEVNVYVP